MSTSRTYKSVRLVAILATLLLLLGMVGLTVGMSANWNSAFADDDVQAVEATDVAAAPADDAVAEPEDVAAQIDAVAAQIDAVVAAQEEEEPAIQLETGDLPDAAKAVPASTIESALSSIFPDSAMRSAIAAAMAADDSFTAADFASTSATKAALHRWAPEGLNLSGKGITDTTGINNLTAVTGVIDLSNNRIKDITPIDLPFAGNDDSFYKCQFNFDGNPIHRWPVKLFNEDDDSTMTFYTTRNDKFVSLNSGVFEGEAKYLYDGQDITQNVYYDVKVGSANDGYNWASNRFRPHFLSNYSQATGDFATNEDHAVITVTPGDTFQYIISARTASWGYLNNYSTTTEGSPQSVSQDYTWRLTNTFYIPVSQEITFQELKGIKVVKTDSSTGEAMSGVEFKLYKDEARTQQIGETKATDSNGVVKWDGLAAGTYYLWEEVPDGYTASGDNPRAVTIEASTDTDRNNLTGGVESITVNHPGDSWVADWDNWYPTAEAITGALVLTDDSPAPTTLTSTKSKVYAEIGADNNIQFGVTSAYTGDTPEFTLTMGGQTTNPTSLAAASTAVNNYLKDGSLNAADAEGIKLVGTASTQLGEETFTEVDISNSPVSYRMKKERVTEAPAAVDPSKTGYGFWEGDTVTYKITVENLCGCVLTMDVSDQFVEDNGAFENLKYTAVQAGQAPEPAAKTAAGEVAWINEDQSKNTSVAPHIQLGPNAIAEIYVTAQVSSDAAEWLATANADHVPDRDDMWNYTSDTAAAEAAAEQVTTVGGNDDGYVNVAQTSNVTAYEYVADAPGGCGAVVGQLPNDDDYANTPVQELKPSYTMEKYRESLAPIKETTAGTSAERYGFYVGNTVTYKAIITNTGDMDLILDVSDKFDEGNFSTPKVTDVQFAANATVAAEPPSKGNKAGSDDVSYGRIISGKGTDCAKIEIKVGGYAEVTFTAEVKDNPEYLAPKASDGRGDTKQPNDGYQNTVTTDNVKATLSFEDSSTGETRTLEYTATDFPNDLNKRTDVADTPVQIPEPSYEMSKCRVTDAPVKESDPDHYGFFKGDEVTYEVTVVNTGDMDLTMNVADKFNEGSFSTPVVKEVKFYEQDAAEPIDSNDFGSVLSALGKDNVNIEIKVGGYAVVTYTANVRQNREYLAPTTDDKKDNASDGYLNTATTSNVVASISYTDPNTGEDVTFTQRLEKQTDTANTPVQHTAAVAVTGDSSVLLFTFGLLIGFGFLFLAISRTTGNSFAGASSFVDGVSAKPSRNRAKQAPIEAVSRSTHQRSSRKDQRRSR